MPDPTLKAAPESIGHRILRAMFVVIFFQLFWKFGGFLITLLVGRLFGSGPESDAYFFVTETVVFLLQTLCLKVFIPLVVPIFKEEMERHGEEAAQRFGNTVLNLTILVLAVLTAAGLLFAPQVIRLFAEGFNEQQTALSVRLMRWMFPGVFAICLATVTYALLNSYNVFSYAAAGDAVQKTIWAALFLVAAVAGLSTHRLLDALAVAFIISTVGMLLTHLVGLRSKARFYRLGLPALSGLRIAQEAAILAAHVAALAAGLWLCGRFARSLPSDGARLALQQVVLVVVVATYLMLLWWRARGRATPMAKFASLAVPLLFGILFAKYRDIVTNLFASFTGTGVFSDLKYARKVGEAPNTLVIAALSVAILPHLCELATQSKWGDFAHVMTRTIRGVLVFFVPLAALIVVLRKPIIQLLFESGDWSDYHLDRAGDALGLYILSLPFFAIENPIQQSFFAMQRMWTPTFIGILSTGFHILFLFIGIEWLGFGYFAVVATVYVVARALKNVILLFVMRFHVRILPWRQTSVFLAKALVATMGVIGASWGSYTLLTRLLPLDPYRRHEVMIDTFNVELTGWEGDNVVELKIANASEEPLRSLKRDVWSDFCQRAWRADWATLFRDILPEFVRLRDSEHALRACYCRSPRRVAGLRRDLTDFDPMKIRSLRFQVTVNSPTELTLELVARDRRSFRHEPIQVGAGTPQSIEVEMADFKAGNALKDVVGLWLLDTTRVRRVARETTTLAVDNVEIRQTGAEMFRCVDSFEPTPEPWLLKDSAAAIPAPIADTKERAGEPEMALRLDRSESRRQIISRPLSHLRLADSRVLTFKARADKTCRVGVTLDAPREGDVVDRLKFAASVDVKASDRRRSYPVPVGAFQAQTAEGRFRPSQIDYLKLDVPAGVDFWLDNVEFVREAKGPRIGSISVIYELFKLIYVAVPTAIAFAAFVVLLLLLRVEEARTTWDWMKEKALKKVIARIRR